MNKRIVEQNELEEFDIFELSNLGELTLEKIRICFGNLNSDLDDIYTIDYNLKLFEKINKKYLKKLQESHKRVRDFETERDLKMVKLELKQLRKKGGKNGQRRNRRKVRKGSRHRSKSLGTWAY